MSSLPHCCFCDVPFLLSSSAQSCQIDNVLSIPCVRFKRERDWLTYLFKQPLVTRNHLRMRPLSLSSLLLISSFLPRLTCAVHVDVWLTKDCSGDTDSTYTLDLDGGCVSIDSGAWTLSYTSNIDCFFSMWADAECTERGDFTILHSSCLLPGYKVFSVQCVTV